MKRSRSLLLCTIAVACQFPSYTLDSGAGGTSSSAGAAGAPNVPVPNGGSTAAPDPCLDNPCQNEGECVATLAGSTVCLCAPGYRGDYCEATLDGCDPNPCLNGGSCFDGAQSVYCMCPDGWDGATCEHDHDDCADEPCLNGGSCVDAFQGRTCTCSPGFAGDSCQGALLPTCKAIQVVAPDATDGVYSVDPDGPGQGNPPLEVQCDMDDEAWTMVGQERVGVAGTFKFLGVSVGEPGDTAREGNGLFGEQFRGLYSEVWLTWSNASSVGDGIYFRVNEEMFSNNVRSAMPVSDFYTTNTTLQDWVNATGGAVLCRGSQSPDVRPGDSSWAIKPKDDTNALCGCSSHGWTGRGAFYGGHSDPTLCNPSGGGWAGVTDNGGAKGNVEDWWLQIWIR